MMIELRVDDMTCGSCVSTITKAVKSIDPNAQVEVDVKQRLVRLESEADSQQFQNAIRDAGFTVGQADQSSQQNKTSKGCC